MFIHEIIIIRKLNGWKGGEMLALFEPYQWNYSIVRKVLANQYNINEMEKYYAIKSPHSTKDALW